VYSSEKLLSPPLLTVDGDTQDVSIRSSKEGLTYYYSVYQIEQTGEIQIAVDGEDLAGNHGIQDYHIGICQIFVK
ncbi:MAG: hypothetical protein DRP89_05035, partial [Candidatus Neomarinimicrobiota bacterium]